MPLFAIVLVLLGLFLFIPLLLFPISLVTDLRAKKRRVPPYVLSFCVTLIPILLYVFLPSGGPKLSDWTELAPVSGILVLAWYGLVFAAFAWDVKHNPQTREQLEEEERKKIKQYPPSGSRQVQGILALIRLPRPDAHNLIALIREQQIQKGYVISAGCLSKVLVAGNSIGDQAYAYAAIRAQFSSLGGEDLIKRTVRFTFQSPDGSEGEYFIVFDRL